MCKKLKAFDCEENYTVSPTNVTESSVSETIINTTNSILDSTNLKKFIRDSIIGCIEPRLYSQKTFVTVTQTQDIDMRLHPTELVMRAILGKLIEPYYKNNVLTGVQEREEGKVTLVRVKKLRDFTIVGNNFIIPFNPIHGCFLYINIKREIKNESSVVSTYTFTFFGKNHQKACKWIERRYLRLLNAYYNRISSKEITITSYSQPNSNNTYYIPKRSLKSVFINHEIKENLFKTLKTFTQEKTSRLYNNLQEPYHFNILLYGTPGTGKNSIIHSIATEFNRTVTTINSGFFKYDGNASNNFNDIITQFMFSIETIFVFDEIDLIVKNRETETLSTEDRSILATLLDFLDKISNGNIVFLCTNHKEKLDPALIRSGRVNLKLELTNWDKSLLLEALSYHDVSLEQFKQYLNKDDIDIESKGFYINPSLAMEIIRKIKLDNIGIYEKTTEETDE